jgi:transcriptional antiterminator RfaH
MAYWACAQLAPSRERLALHCLQQVAGFEVYAPRIKAPRGARSRNPRLLFPGYVFVLIVLQWHAAMRTPGVVRLVLDGGIPARVPDNVIAELRARERNGLLQLPEPRRFRAGERVRVIHGPLVGLEGLVAGRASGSSSCSVCWEGHGRCCRWRTWSWRGERKR